MERPIVVAVFDRGELQSVRVLAPERERLVALAAGAAGAVLVLGGMVAAAALLSALHLVVHGPTFFLSWIGVAAAVALFSARWAGARAGRYRLGVDMDADAFAMHEVDFVRRAGRDYEVGLLPGMSGSIEQGGRSLPLEALTRKGAVHVPVPETGKVRVEAGRMTYVVSRRKIELCGERRPLQELRESVDWLAVRTARRLIRSAAFGTPVAALVTMLGAVPAALAVTENDARFAIPSNATPLEVEKLIFRKAQFESSELHQCFDRLPLVCQRSGYVGVWLSLSREGDVVGHGVTRSTYKDDCPVTACMENVVSSWTFQPIPERMTVVIPVQVRRTKKPLRQSDNVEFVTPEVAGPAADGQGDAGAVRLTEEPAQVF